MHSSIDRFHVTSLTSENQNHISKKAGWLIFFTCYRGNSLLKVWAISDVWLLNNQWPNFCHAILSRVFELHKNITICHKFYVNGWSMNNLNCFVDIFSKINRLPLVIISFRCSVLWPPYWCSTVVHQHGGSIHSYQTLKRSEIFISW